MSFVAEAVDVDHQQRELLVAVGAVEGAAGGLEEERPVRQAGERVVEREVLHLGRLGQRAVHRHIGSTSSGTR